MLAEKRNEIFRAIQEAEQKIDSIIEVSKNIQKADINTSFVFNREEFIHATNLLCVYLVTTLEYCLKTAFEVDMNDSGWRNNYDHFFVLAGRFGYKDLLENQLKKRRREETSFRSLITQRNNYIHQRKDVDASSEDIKKYFDHAKSIVYLIVETMPNRLVFEADAEGKYIDKSIEQILGRPSVLNKIIEPLAQAFSSKESPNFELVIRIQNKKNEEQNN